MARERRSTSTSTLASRLSLILVFALAASAGLFAATSLLARDDPGIAHVSEASGALVVAAGAIVGLAVGAAAAGLRSGRRRSGLAGMGFAVAILGTGAVLGPAGLVPLGYLMLPAGIAIAVAFAWKGDRSQDG